MVVKDLLEELVRMVAEMADQTLQEDLELLTLAVAVVVQVV